MNIFREILKTYKAEKKYHIVPFHKRDELVSKQMEDFMNYYYEKYAEIYNKFIKEQLND